MGSAGYFYPLARVREQVEALQGLRQGHAAALAGAAKQRTLSVAALAKRQGPSERPSARPPAATETCDVQRAKGVAGRANEYKVGPTNYIKAVCYGRF